MYRSDLEVYFLYGTQQWPAEIPYICNDIIFCFFYDHLNIIRKIHNIQNLYPVLFAIKKYFK